MGSQKIESLIKEKLKRDNQNIITKKIQSLGI